jgi:hypothetical protein
MATAPSLSPGQQPFANVEFAAAPRIFQLWASRWISAEAPRPGRQPTAAALTAAQKSSITSAGAGELAAR